MRARNIGIAVILVAVLIVSIYLYQSFSGPLFHSTYKVGDEIRGFPTEEMSVTISDVIRTKTLNMFNIPFSSQVWIANVYMGVPGLSAHYTLGEAEDYVVLAVAIHNLGNSSLYFNRASDFTDRVSDSKSKYFVLTYGAENHEADPLAITLVPVSGEYISGPAKNLHWGWGMNVANPEAMTVLAPYQTAYCYFVFKMGQYYEPNQLICREGYNDNPDFSVNLKAS